jgi:PAS domain S-box-containing protein
MRPVAKIDARLLEESADELYEHAPCGYVSSLPDGTIVRVNQTFLDWTGFDREELLSGRRFQDLLSVPGKIFHETHYAPLLRMQGFANEIALDIVKADGSVLPSLVNAFQKHDAAGKPLLNRTTIFNATDRRKYERELLLARRKAEELAKSKSDLLSMISHDVRTPLSGMMMALQILERGELSPVQRKYLSIVRSSADNLLNLTSQLLDASRIESGRLTLEAREFKLRELLQGLCVNLAPKAEDKGLELRLEIADQVADRLIGDPVKIGQVLSNLLYNAIKFTNAGSVTLIVRSGGAAADGRVALDFAVKDTGIGIPEDRLASIFEEFTQADYDTGMKFGGAGLGLSICRKLLALYGSTMQVESQLGQGSTFSFRLSLQPA